MATPVRPATSKPSRLQCLRCFGKLCSRCGDASAGKAEWRDGPIIGVRSWKIDDGVFGMQRPFASSMVEFGLADQFQR